MGAWSPPPIVKCLSPFPREVLYVCLVQAMDANDLTSQMLTYQPLNIYFYYLKLICVVPMDMTAGVQLSDPHGDGVTRDCELPKGMLGTELQSSASTVCAFTPEPSLQLLKLTGNCSKVLVMGLFAYLIEEVRVV